jgi:hypothetical protein
VARTPAARPQARPKLSPKSKSPPIGACQPPQLALDLRPEVQQWPKQHPDLDREQRPEVQRMLDDLERVEEIPAAIGCLVKETMALGQVPMICAGFVWDPAKP